MPNRFRKAFESQLQTVSIESLPVEGTIPEWLFGTYLRNGPAQFELEKARYWHWFDGLAMLHKYQFANGKVSFKNRYLQTKNYQEDMASQSLNYRMPGTDPKRSLMQKLSAPLAMKFTDNTNINTVQIDGAYLALTERIEAYQFDLDSLQTLAEFKYETQLGKIMATGHPHYDPKSKTLFNYMLRFGMPSTYEIYRLVGRKHYLIAKLPRWNPSYIHSFSMTENYIILTEYPMKLSPFNLLNFLFTDTPFFDNFVWNPQLSTLITVIEKSSGKIVKQLETEAFFSWHHINAFELAGNIFLDLAAYNDSTIVQGLYLDTMRSDTQFTTTMPAYRRYCISLENPRQTTISFEGISDDNGIELPQINYNRYNAKPYQYVYGLSIANNQRDFVNQIVKIDTEQKSVSESWFCDGHYPSEAVFAARPNGREEDDGVILSTVYDSTSEVSYLLILDARNFETIATAQIPIRIPFGFHGRWYPDGNMYAI